MAEIVRANAGMAALVIAVMGTQLAFIMGVLVGAYLEDRWDICGVYNFIRKRKKRGT